jgi:uncharacterized protein YndB with AHSA1/START domain
MSDSRLLEVTESIPAPPEKVFALLTDPNRHTEIDGAHMLRGLASGRCPVTGIGDVFVMNMSQEGIGDYQMRSEVVDFEPNRRIIWAPALHPPNALRDKLGDVDLSGYVWSWELEPTASGGTRLTHTYDWSGVFDARALPLFPRVSEEQMIASIALIAEACADSVPPNGDRGGQG